MATFEEQANALDLSNTALLQDLAKRGIVPQFQRDPWTEHCWKAVFAALGLDWDEERVKYGRWLENFINESAAGAEKARREAILTQGLPGR